MPQKTAQPLRDAVDFDAYDWLSNQAPHYLTAIEQQLANGSTPLDIRIMLSRWVGPERQGLALRCEQAARYIQRAGG